MLRNDVYGIAMLAIVVWIILIYTVVSRPTRRFSTSQPRRFRPPFRPDLKDTGQQLHAVTAASFQRQRLLNHSELDAFKIIEDDIGAAHRGYRVFAQTSLGEFLDSSNDDAFRSAFHSINSKRVDILIVDNDSWPVVAVEYQGSGHYQGDAAARDAVKKEALSKAGVRYVEVFPNDSAEQIRSRVREQLGWRTAAPTISALRAQRA